MLGCPLGGWSWPNIHCILKLCYFKDLLLLSLKSITNDALVTQIDTSYGLSMQHFQVFAKLWEFTIELQLVDDTPGSIHWKFLKGTLALRQTKLNSLGQSVRQWTP
jgi:hypothetical protein